MNKFKELTIESKKKLSPFEIKAIESLNTFFNKADCFFITSPKIITAQIYKIDVTKFRLIKNTIIAEYGKSVLPILSEIENSIQSIKSYGMKSGKRVLTGYNQERKVIDRKQKEGRRGKYYYSKNNQYSNENNPCPTELINQIYCGDSQDVLLQFPNNCIDLIFTSPPYNFGLEYEESNDDHNWDLYFEKLFLILDQCIRVLKFGGRLIINVQPLFSDYIPSHHLISQQLIKRKLIWKGEILWEKNNYNCKYTAWGSWKSPSNPYLKYTWEFIEIFCKGEMKKAGEKDNIDISADEFKEWVVAKWSVAPERNMKKFDHPAMFPEKLVERVLKLFSYQNDIILDPFNGVGTTTAVAKKLNRQFVGIDKSKQYCTSARNRLE